MAHPPHPSDPKLHTLSLAQGKATITDEGNGPVILAIHGLPGSVRDFRWLASNLNNDYRIVRVNLPGFGGTPAQTSTGYTLEDRTNFVLTVMDALSLDNVIPLGHSMGGTVAISIAARYPDRVRGLALLASVAVEPHPVLKRTRSKLLSTLLKFWPSRQLLSPILRRAFIQLGFSKSLATEAFIMTMHYISNTHFQTHQANIYALQVPTLVAWAEDDPLLPASFSRQLAQTCPSGPRLTFPTGGHNIQKTQAIELGEAFRAWI